MSAWLQAGILEEMVEDTMDVMDDDELEEAADGEVEKVLYELTAGEWQFLDYLCTWQFVRWCLCLSEDVAGVFVVGNKWSWKRKYSYGEGRKG